MGRDLKGSPNMSHHEPGWPIVVSDIKPSGETIVFQASSDELDWLKADLDIMKIEAFQVSLKLTRFRKSGLKVNGSMKCMVQQSCVVSLEPVEQLLDIAVERSFLPLRDLKRENERVEAGELLLDVDDDCEIDELVGGMVDLWNILIEEISLELDPFPRHVDVQREITDESGDEGEELQKTRPFSSLKALINENKSKK